MNNFILKGNIGYSLSPRELCTVSHGYLVCKDGKSEGVYTRLPKEYQEYPLYDYGDFLIIPGLVDLHIHAPQYAFRGLGMNLELMEWLEERAFPEEKKYTDTDYARAAYSIFAQHMKAGATTRACIFATIHQPATDILMELMEESGLITYVGKVNMDRLSPPELCEASADMAEAVTRRWLDGLEGKFNRTKPILTPRFIPSCSDELMKRLGRIQLEYALPVQSHLSENQNEISLVGELCPESRFYGDAYDRFGLFGKTIDSSRCFNTIMAHCVWSSPEEIQLMKDNGVFAAHCPMSNSNLSSGIAPVRKYIDAGLKIGLGSDVGGGHCESIFQTITHAIQVSKLYNRLIDQECSPITFNEAFYMATMGGGEFFGRVGSFAPGYELDAIILDDSSLPHPQELSVSERIERAIWLSLDSVGIRAKYVCGQKILG